MSEPRPLSPTSAPPAWALAEAERLRRKVREMGAEEAEYELAMALWVAGGTQHAE